MSPRCRRVTSNALSRENRLYVHRIQCTPNIEYIRKMFAAESPLPDTARPTRPNRPELFATEALRRDTARRKRPNLPGVRRSVNLPAPLEQDPFPRSLIGRAVPSQDARSANQLIPESACLKPSFYSPNRRKYRSALCRNPLPAVDSNRLILKMS